MLEQHRVNISSTDAIKTPVGGNDTKVQFDVENSKFAGSFAMSQACFP